MIHVYDAAGNVIELHENKGGVQTAHALHVKKRPHALARYPLRMMLRA